jgi:hypothetical protein
MYVGIATYKSLRQIIIIITHCCQFLSPWHVKSLTCRAQFPGFKLALVKIIIGGEGKGWVLINSPSTSRKDYDGEEESCDSVDVEMKTF